VAVNLLDDDWQPGEEREGYASRERRPGRALGAERIGADGAHEVRNSTASRSAWRFEGLSLGPGRNARARTATRL
jgi:hypothetical protein